MKKKARQKKEHLVAVWLPAQLLRALDKEVALYDTDRSKLIREALRKQLKTSREVLRLAHAPKER